MGSLGCNWHIISCSCMYLGSSLQNRHEIICGIVKLSPPPSVHFFYPNLQVTWIHFVCPRNQGTCMNKMWCVNCNLKNPFISMRSYFYWETLLSSGFNCDSQKLLTSLSLLISQQVDVLEQHTMPEHIYALPCDFNQKIIFNCMSWEERSEAFCELKKKCQNFENVTTVGA